MKINNKSMRIFAMFASVLMLTIVAVPMVAASGTPPIISPGIRQPIITTCQSCGQAVMIIPPRPDMIVGPAFTPLRCPICRRIVMVAPTTGWRIIPIPPSTPILPPMPILPPI